MALENNSNRLTIAALEERKMGSTSPMAAVSHEATAVISNGGGVVGGGDGVVLSRAAGSR